MADDSTATSEIPQGYAPLPLPRGFGKLVGPLYRRFGADGTATMGFRVEERMTNGVRNAHGGMLMTFADLAWGHVVSIETSSYWATVRLSCDFLSGARLGDWVEGSGETLSAADGLYIVRGGVWCGERLLLTGTGVFKPLERRAPRPGERAFIAPAKD